MTCDSKARSPLESLNVHFAFIHPLLESVFLPISEVLHEVNHHHHPVDRKFWDYQSICLRIEQYCSRYVLHTMATPRLLDQRSFS
jgi:hypothetical protein